MVSKKFAPELFSLEKSVLSFKLLKSIAANATFAHAPGLMVFSLKFISRTFFISTRGLSHSTHFSSHTQKFLFFLHIFESEGA
jgi:hypothetical protein